jgi:hypothetical protein
LHGIAEEPGEYEFCRADDDSARYLGGVEAGRASACDDRGLEVDGEIRTGQVRVCGGMI